MRYYYPKTGIFYEDIFEAWRDWETPCKEPHCQDCDYGETVCLLDWVMENKEEAIKIMGIIPYNNICEYLGVLPIQVFGFCGEEYYINDEGYVHNITYDRDATGIEVCNLLKYPEEIEII